MRTASDIKLGNERIAHSIRLPGAINHHSVGTLEHTLDSSSVIVYSIPDTRVTKLFSTCRAREKDQLASPSVVRRVNMNGLSSIGDSPGE